MKKITVNKTRILTAAAALVAVFSLAGAAAMPCRRFPGPRSPAARKPPRDRCGGNHGHPAPTPEPRPLWSCPPA